uniref:BOS complex subunit TMEM147 n=1 Tax=Schistocephalus solidus TaxID=70667 RepID=A0A0X3P9T9_SCHSO
MGFFHLINCIILATGPHVILYKTCGMKEHDAFWRCFKVLLLYGFTQLLRIFLATLVHINFNMASQAGLLNYEMLGIVLNFLAVRLVFCYLVGRSQLAVFIGCIGWSCGDLVFTKYIPIWVGTKDLEFDWTYLSLSFDANIDLIFHLIIFFMPWLLMRKEKNLPAALLAVISFVLASFRLSIFGLFERQFTGGFQILAKLLFASFLGLVALGLKVVWTIEAAVEPKHSQNERSFLGFATEFMNKSAVYGLQAVKKATTGSPTPRSGRKGGH